MVNVMWPRCHLKSALLPAIYEAEHWAYFTVEQAVPPSTHRPVAYSCTCTVGAKAENAHASLGPDVETLG